MVWKIILFIFFHVCTDVYPANPSRLRDWITDRTDHFEHPYSAIPHPEPRLRNNLEEDAAFWMGAGQRILSEHLNQKEPIRQARNVIFFLGDGMSIPTVTASRIYKGQKSEGQNGEEAKLTMETFPYTGLSKTYCVDSQVADSACSATAYLCGVKANEGTIGVTAKVIKGDCSAMKDPNNKVDSLLQWAQEAGKATGLVTTTRITHASPAGTYAHTASRDWENDAKICQANQDSNDCDDIAEQLVLLNPGKNIKVILGGGRREFIPNTETDIEYDLQGKRTDGVNLITEWIQDKQRRNVTSSYVHERKDLLNIDINKTDYLLGLFDYDHMEYYVDADPTTEPTLAEMTTVAIRMLQKEKKGFFLFVEGGRIDHAHHETLGMKSLEETIQFDNAIQSAMQVTKAEDTLIVVTADHAHTMTISGYPNRGNNILSFAGTTKDNAQFTTLSYANGPGYRSSDDTIGDEDTTSSDFRQPATFPMDSETHGGDDVAVFAHGAHSHLFQGVYEQNYIPHAVGYAACIGKGKTYCLQ